MITERGMRKAKKEARSWPESGQGCENGGLEQGQGRSKGRRTIATRNEYVNMITPILCITPRYRCDADTADPMSVLRFALLSPCEKFPVAREHHHESFLCGYAESGLPELAALLASSCPLRLIPTCAAKACPSGHVLVHRASRYHMFMARLQSVFLVYSSTVVIGMLKPICSRKSASFTRGQHDRGGNLAFLRSSPFNIGLPPS